MSTLGLTEKYFTALKDMEQRWQDRSDLKIMLGVYYERVLGDRAQAHLKYGEAKEIYNALYESYQSQGLPTGSMLLSYCTFLRLLGEDKEAHRVWQSFDAKLCEDPSFCVELKKLVKKMALSPSREEMLESLTAQGVYEVDED